MRTVSYRHEELEPIIFSPYIHIISDKDEQNIANIINKNVFEELTKKEKTLLWENRYIISQNPEVKHD